MLPIVITIPNYIKEAKLSEKQRPVYWEYDGTDIKAKSKKLLQRYIGDREGVIMNNGKVLPRHLDARYTIVEVIKAKKARYYLADTETDELVIANITQAGKPRIIKIKGQDIYSGNVREFTRGVIMEQIKESFKPYIKNTPKITEYPIEIICEIHTPVKNINDRAKQGVGGRWDVDNHAYPYLKAFPDLLTEEGIIEDDDRLHITIPAHAIYNPCDKEEDRKLVFIIKKDDRDIIKNNKHYGAKHRQAEQSVWRLIFERRLWED